MYLASFDSLVVTIVVVVVAYLLSIPFFVAATVLLLLSMDRSFTYIYQIIAVAIDRKLENT
jgi:hypothetical protein